MNEARTDSVTASSCLPKVTSFILVVNKKLNLNLNFFCLSLTDTHLLVELPFCEPGNVWSSKVFLLNHIDYVSLNSNLWDGNAPSLGNSWEPQKSKMAAVILVN